MELYNTLSRRRARLQPVGKGRTTALPITIYACGITPYDKPHLGHAATAIRCAVLRQYLSLLGYSVRYVQNVTDIDDKIVNRARQWGKQPQDIARMFTQEYHDELSRFGVPVPDSEPHVSEHIGTIIAYIEDLLARGHAYVSEYGDVYFDVQSGTTYGNLSGHRPEEVLTGTRDTIGRHKRHALDFVLWKRIDDPFESFESPWGRGRPGWHTECCAMSNALLGNTIDIHCGGLDLVFPHHENEIIQAECRNGVPYARWWFHLGLVLVDGLKMSKSQGNFTSMAEARQQYGVSLLVYAILTFHYRSPIAVCDELFTNNSNRLVDLYWFCDAVVRAFPDNAGGSVPDGFVDRPLAYQSSQVLRAQFFRAMSCDLNTPLALVALDGAVREGMRLLKDPGRHRDELLELRGLIELLGSILLLFPNECSMTNVFDEVMRLVRARYKARGEVLQELSLEELEQTVNERDRLRKQRRYAEADVLRRNLAGAGIVCMDGVPRRWRIAATRPAKN